MKRAAALPRDLCAAKLGATIVRFTMPRKAPARFRLLLLTLSLLATVPANAGRKATSPMGLFPSSSFTAASGSTFITHFITKPSCETPPGSRTRAKTSGPTLNTTPDAKPALTSAEQRIWDDAVAYYVANYAAKDLLFSTELIQLKDQLGDFEDCDELSGRKRKFCDAGYQQS